MDRYYKVAKFPTRNIKTPILLVYGGSDSLVDIRVMLKELPRHTMAKEIPHFEHLDFLWGQEVDKLVFPYVFEALEIYAGRDHLRSFGRSIRRAIRQAGQSSSDDVSSSITVGEISDIAPGLHGDAPVDGYAASVDTSPESAKDISPPAKFFGGVPTSIDKQKDPDTPIRSRLLEINSLGAGSNTKHKRSGSRSSIRSLDSIKVFGEHGISLGAGRATVGGISSPEGSTPSNSRDDGSKNRGKKRQS